MGNCFNKDKGSIKKAKQAHYRIQKADESTFVEDFDPEMAELENPPPAKPLDNDPIVYAQWKLDCSLQMKLEVLAMFSVIERKVASFEKKVKSETSRTDDDKILGCAFMDYQDSCRLSRDRLEILLNRDTRRHQACLNELQLKKNAWENELQRSLTKYRVNLNFRDIPEVASSNDTNEPSKNLTEGPFKKTTLFGAKR